MGLKSLFKRKKKRPLSLQGNAPTSTASHASASSLDSRSRIERELQLVFEKFDANGDGKISFSELKSIMSSIGDSPADDELIRTTIDEADSDGDGFIDLSEFVELNTKGIDSDEAMENLKGAFAVFDADKNGSITAEELRHVLDSLGEGYSIDECERMIAGVDANGDGTISFEEFKRMMTMGSFEAR